MKIFYYNVLVRKNHIIDGGYYYHNNNVLGFGSDSAIDETEVTIPQAISKIFLSAPINENGQFLSVADIETQAQSFLESKGFTVTSQNIIDAKVLATQLILEEARVVRNGYLLDTDWTQLKDTPLTSEQEALWATYRQDLRDIPEDFSTVLRYCDIIWPTIPN